MNQQNPIFIKSVAWLGGILLGLTSLTTSAALPAFMTLTGETQGKVNGSVAQPGREGMMEVVEFSHSVSQVIDSASGLSTGKVQHRPIRVTKPVDRASAILMNILTNNENITEFKIDFWRPGESGAEELFYTVELVNAQIVGISQASGSEDELQQKPAQEVISFIYQKIIWTWTDGGIAAEDDWSTPPP